MKDRFELNYRRRAPKTESEAVSGQGNVVRGSNAPKPRLLHDHRYKDALVEYLDNLEE